MSTYLHQDNWSALALHPLGFQCSLQAFVYPCKLVRKLPCLISYSVVGWQSLRCGLHLEEFRAVNCYRKVC